MNDRTEGAVMSVLKTETRGSITVEAALIMGITVMVICSVTVLTLIMRDRVYAAAYCRIEAEKLEDESAAPAAPDLLWTEGRCDMDRGKSGMGLLSSCAGSVSMSGTGRLLWPDKEISYEEQALIRLYDQPGFLMKCRMIEELME